VPTIRGGDLIADDTIGYGFARFRSVRLLLRMAFHRAAVVRAVSPGARAMAIRFGCPPEKITVVPRNIREDCFVDDVPAFRAACRREIAARYGLDGRTIVVAAGRLLPVKGFDDLVRAMPRLLAEIPSAVALICGPNRVDPQVGEYGAYLERLAREVGVGQHVILTGQIAPERMASYLAAADAVAVPSLIEGGNKILVEGAALGTPFVATDTSGTIGFFTASEGVSVPTRQPERLAVALIELLADRVAWERRSAACLAGRARFHSHSVAAAMQQVYQRAIDHHTLARPGSPSVQTRRES
jgi:glycosyltransferase involved in cell wall biosynthesis